MRSSASASAPAPHERRPYSIALHTEQPCDYRRRCGRVARLRAGPRAELILERCGVHGMEALNGGVHTDYRQAVTPSDVQMVYR